MDDMYNQHETPTGDAGATVGHYLTGTLAAADASVRLLTWLRRRRLNSQEQELTPAHLEPGDLEQAGKLLDPKRQAYDAMLGRDEGRSADSRTALMAWVSAQPHRDGDPQAELVASRAEARLRELHPDALGRYDALRAGLSPVEAMREVAPLIAAEQERESAHQVYGPLLDPATGIGRDEPQPGTAAAAGQSPEVRYAPLVRDVLNAQLATDVLRDDAWPTLAGALQHAEQLGAQPADLLRHIAGQRELDSAKHVAEVLHHRLEHHLVEQRTPTAADVAASSYPTPLTAAAAPAGTTTADPFAAGSGEHLELHKTRLVGPDPATLGAAAELGRAADAERHAAQASAATADDTSTPHVDERREGLSDAAAHTHRATTDQSTATALLAQADSRPTEAGGPTSAPDTAGQSYPTPVKDVSTAHAALKPATTAAPATRTAIKAASPTTARRR